MQYQEGKLFDNRYELLDYKGSGSFGEVWLAKDTKTDLEVAIKIYIAMDDKGLDEFKSEYQIAFDLNHSNLLHANYLEICHEDHRPYLVMTYCPNGSASKMMGSMAESDAWHFIRDVAAGLAYLHEQNPPIIHQDIKPDNILIAKNGDYVITDFGISKTARSTLTRSAAKVNSTGSIAYMGPERFSKKYHSVKASDIWSFGVTIYEVLVGDLPFCGMGGSMQRQGAEIPELPDNFSQDLNIVMQCCLAKETWDRPTAEQLTEYAALKMKGKSPQFTWGIPDDVAAINPAANALRPQATVVVDNASSEAKPVETSTVKINPNTLNSTIAFRQPRAAQPSNPQPDITEASTVALSSRGSDNAETMRLANDADMKIPTPKKTSNTFFYWIISAVVGLIIGLIIRFIIG